MPGATFPPLNPIHCQCLPQQSGVHLPQGCDALLHAPSLPLPLLSPLLSRAEGAASAFPRTPPRPGLCCRTGRAPLAAAQALPAPRRPALAARASPRAAPGRSWRRRAAAAGRRRRGRSRAGAGGGSAARAAERRDAAGPGRRAGGAGRGAPGCAGLPAAGTGRGLRGAGAALAAGPPASHGPRSPLSSLCSRPVCLQRAQPAVPSHLALLPAFLLSFRHTPTHSCLLPFSSWLGSDPPSKQPCSDLVPK